MSFTSDDAGSYWFNITADDQRGVANSTITQNWTVTIAALQDDPDTPNTPSDVQCSFEYYIVGDTVYCTDNSHGDITIWLWDFGDGFGSASPNPSHTYLTSGNYILSLTVIDASGNEGKAGTEISIELSEDNPVDWEDDGWNIHLGDGWVASISAAGVAVFGAALAISSRFSLPFLPSKLRLIIGLAMMAVSLYYLGVH